MPSPLDDCPYLTADLPGCRGSIKQHIEDFVVEEVPLYLPSGEGTHAYIHFEKRGLTTHAAVERIARGLGCRSRDVGYAGLKDARGVTRQTVSVEHVPLERIRALEIPGLRILSVTSHGNKLRIGHAAGNRFVIRLRDCVSDAVRLAEPIIERLRARGVPNYFGPQRFGRRGMNAAVGRAGLLKDYAEALAIMLGRPQAGDDPEETRSRELFDSGQLAACLTAWPAKCRDEARLTRSLMNRPDALAAVWRSIDRRMRTLYFSALQSAVFNCVLARRIDSFDRLIDGDVGWKHANGVSFAVTDVEADQPRCAAFEISPTGPVFGARMKAPAGEAGALEASVMAELAAPDVGRRTACGVTLDGTRRPLRVPLEDVTMSEGSDDNGSYVELAFCLPRGAYATAVVREIAKT